MQLIRCPFAKDTNLGMYATKHKAAMLTPHCAVQQGLDVHNICIKIGKKKKTPKNAVVHMPGQ